VFVSPRIVELNGDQQVIVAPIFTRLICIILVGQTRAVRGFSAPDYLHHIKHALISQKYNKTVRVLEHAILNTIRSGSGPVHWLR
jgi:hypothetical protein